jgi:TPR repeat protein
MCAPTCIRSLRLSLAFSTALASMVAPVAGNYASAAVSSSPADVQEEQLRKQVADVVNTPVNFCDGAAEAAHLMAELKAMGELNQHQLANHRPGPDDVTRAEDRAVLANKADGGDMVGDLPYVTDYENAERRGDVKKQQELFDKMSPAAQAQAANWDRNFLLAIKLWTPLADAGDVRSQLNLAGLYSFSTTGFSAKYIPEPDAKVVEIMKKVFPHYSRVDPPENLPLAFKYSRLAAENGNMWGQWALGRAYACGFGTEKNLVLAYMWLSVGLAKRGVTTEMTGASLPMEGSQKQSGLDRDYVAAQMKAEEIEQAKQLVQQCLNSKYQNCL